ncbi:MAG: hypothetical protein AAF081_19690, partial [Actinomycetota bacterium]
MTQPRPSHRLLALVAFVLVSLLGVPAAAGETSFDAADKTDADIARFGFAVDTSDLAAIKLHCRGSIADTPVIGCSWRAPDDAAIVGFQLWNLQTAPTEGVRNLVAELGLDANSYRDGAVEAPASYLYVVLGIDADGEVVARSRADRVRLGDPAIERLRLTCDGVERDTPAVACHWTAPDDAAVASYVLHRNSKGQERTAIATLGADSTGFTDTTVECGVRYGYRIFGLDADGQVVAMSRRDAAGCGDRDHARVTGRSEVDAERTRGDGHDPKRDTDAAVGSDTGADAGDTVVAAVTETTDRARSADHDRRDAD